MKIVEKGV